jgi:hypothetical protein
MYRPYISVEQKVNPHEHGTNEWVAYPVRFACHMESTTLELAEVLKEDGHEGGDVLCRLLCRALRKGHHYLLVVIVGRVRTTVSP